MTKLNQFRQVQEKKEPNWIKVMIVLVLFFGSGIAIFVSGIFTSAPSSLSGLDTASIGNIHWHADAVFNVCGERKLLPKPASDVHLGTQLMHTHQDGRMHIEGYVGNPSDITLGKFMDSIFITFTNNQLFDKKAGDVCNGHQGKIVLLVNGVENSQLADYSIRDGDKYDIRFE